MDRRTGTHPDAHAIPNSSGTRTSDCSRTDVAAIIAGGIAQADCPSLPVIAQEQKAPGCFSRVFGASSVASEGPFVVATAINIVGRVTV
mmetsp:Transcript_12379/g.19064  ORF Transcript_12379/g.19064 Transcript_12379/m.19064 type:complete len:89 (-) Transcript_12379:849-1115(-)